MQRTNARKQHKSSPAQRRRRFVLRTVLTSTLIMGVLLYFAFTSYAGRVGNAVGSAKAALEAGQYEKAAALTEQLLSGDAALGDEDRETLTELLNRSRFLQAEALMNAGDYAAAEEGFLALGEYGEAKRRVTECRYRSAAVMKEAGSYEEAAAAFYALGGYGDSLEQYDGCRYEMALEAEKAGDTETAFQGYLELGSFLDAADRAEQLAVRMTGVSDPKIALQVAQGYEEKDIPAVERLNAERSALPQHSLAVGFYHTVGLTDSGTVLAAGDNGYGQCAVESWNGIKAIDAGAYHTVGLKEDGTVVAAGRNSEGQCDVTGWTDIQAIACCDYGTLGLKRDGSVVKCGFGDDDDVAGWKDIVSIGGGSYLAVGVRSGGRLLCTHPSGREESLTGLAEADCNTGYSLGLRVDGTVVSSSGETDWKDCLTVSAASTGYMALKEDGTVLARYFEERNAVDASGIEGANAVAMGGTHFAVRLQDGTVLARGSNQKGECETSSWNLGKRNG